jgi:hypothetical protein
MGLEGFAVDGEGSAARWSGANGLTDFLFVGVLRVRGAGFTIHEEICPFYYIGWHRMHLRTARPPPSNFSKDFLSSLSQVLLTVSALARDNSSPFCRFMLLIIGNSRLFVAVSNHFQGFCKSKESQFVWTYNDEFPNKIEGN